MSFMSFVNFSQFNLGCYEFRNYLNTDIFEALKKAPSQYENISLGRTICPWYHLISVKTALTHTGNIRYASSVTGAPDEA